MIRWFRRRAPEQPDTALVEAQQRVTRLEARSGMIVPHLVGRLERNHFADSVNELFRGEPR